MTGAQVLTHIPSTPAGRVRLPKSGTQLLVALILAGTGHLVGGANLSAQWAESSLLRRGQVSVFMTPFMMNYDERYGLAPDGTDLVEALGADFDTDALGADLLPAVVGAQARFAALVEDSDLALNLGSTQARMLASVIRIPFGASIGVFDWLTVGGVAPLVKRRIELDFLINPENANAGLSPGTGGADVQLFLGQATAALDAVITQVDATCTSAGNGAPACVSGRAFISDASSFFAELQTAYGGPLFLFGQGSAADALNARVDGYRTQMHALAPAAGIDTVFVAPLAFAGEAMSVEQYQTFITDGAWGIGGDPLLPSESLWELGDVEVFAALRLLGSGLDPAETRDRAASRAKSGDTLRVVEPNIGYLLGVKGTYRLGTGIPARPTNRIDIGSGDGLDDMELEVFGRLDMGARFRARFEAVYGVQLEGEVTGRVYEPGQSFSSFLSHQTRVVDPGDYRSWMIAPELRLTPEVTLGARYRSYHQGKDTYGDAVPEAEATLLAAESEINLSQLGVGLSFWPSARSAAQGSWPVAISAEYLAPTGGSGGQVQEVQNYGSNSGYSSKPGRSAVRIVGPTGPYRPQSESSSSACAP